MSWEMEQLSVDGAKISSLEMWISHQGLVTYNTAIKQERWVSDGFKVFEPDWENGAAKEREEG